VGNIYLGEQVDVLDSGPLPRFTFHLSRECVMYSLIARATALFEKYPALLYLMKYGPGIASLDHFVSALRGNFPGQTKSSSSRALRWSRTLLGTARWSGRKDAGPETGSSEESARVRPANAYGPHRVSRMSRAVRAGFPTSPERRAGNVAFAADDMSVMGRGRVSKRHLPSYSILRTAL